MHKFNFQNLADVTPPCFFFGQRFHTLMKNPVANVIESLINLDMHAFKDADAQFTRLRRLEQWVVDLLVNLENCLRDEDDRHKNGKAISCRW